METALHSSSPISWSLFANCIMNYEINEDLLISEVKKTPCEVFVLEHDDPKDYKEYTIKSLEYLETI